jgi:hypothetical protein
MLVRIQQPTLKKDFMKIEQVLAIEVRADSEGFLYNPIQFINLNIKELGFYVVDLEKITLNIWIVPASQLTKERAVGDSLTANHRWMIRSNFNDYRDEIYFTGFDAKTMCDTHDNEVYGEEIPGRYSQHQVRIFTDKEKVEKAIKILETVNPQAKWIIIEVDC